MMSNLLNLAHGNQRKNYIVISARKAADYLKLSDAVFFAELDPENKKGIIKWQANIQDDEESRPAYGFEVDYLNEIKTVLPRTRGKGQKVFTPSVKEKISIINEKWRKKNKTM